MLRGVRCAAFRISSFCSWWWWWLVRLRGGLDLGLRVGLKPLLVNQSSCRWLGESELSAGLSACQTSDGEPACRPLVGVVGRGRGLRRRAADRSLNSPSAGSRDLAFALLRCWRPTGAAWPTGLPKTVRPGCTRARAGELARRRGMLFSPCLSCRVNVAMRTGPRQSLESRVTRATPSLPYRVHESRRYR